MTFIPMIQPRMPSPEPARPAEPPEPEGDADDQDCDFDCGDHVATPSPSGHHSTRVRIDGDGTAMLMPLSELGSELLDRADLHDGMGSGQDPGRVDERVVV